LTRVGLIPGRFYPSTAPAPNLAFTREEYAARASTLCALMREAGVDLLWLTTPEAIAWLHGLTLMWYKANSPMRYPQCYGTAVHAASGRFIHFDNPTERPALSDMSVSTDNRWLPDREAAPNLEFILDQLGKEGWLRGTVGLEFWSYVPNRAISTMFEGAFLCHGCRVIDSSVIARRARRRKSPQEIAYIDKAMEICDIGHRAIVDLLHPGMTELELFGAVNERMMAAGGEFPALIPPFRSLRIVDGEPIVGGHREASRKKIERGELLGADLCGVYNRYHANCKRSYYLGDDPPGHLVDRYQLSGGSFDLIERELYAGMTVGEVNARLRQYYEETGLWTEASGWALGYELGLSLPPDWVGEFYFNVGDHLYLDRVFEPGMVTNFESVFGTGLIDTLVWEADRTRVLSSIPRELIVVPR
jgi:Xaa-Pro aminopeptidase